MVHSHFCSPSNTCHRLRWQFECLCATHWETLYYQINYGGTLKELTRNVKQFKKKVLVSSKCYRTCLTHIAKLGQSLDKCPHKFLKHFFHALSVFCRCRLKDEKWHSKELWLCWEILHDIVSDFLEWLSRMGEIKLETVIDQEMPSDW